MNQYGLLAQRHWERFLPGRYSQIADPNSYFSTLGQQVEQEISDLTDQLAGDDPTGEDYLGKVGRLTAAGQQARERVLSEMVLLPAEPGSPMDEIDPTDWPSSEESSPGWIPLTEDPDHPWWRQEPTETSGPTTTM